MKQKADAVVDDSAANKLAKIRNVPRHVMDAFDNLVPDDAPGQAKASVVILKHVDQVISNHSVSKIGFITQLFYLL